jgi:predicted translin family RNA/ssDNA-binding protein
MSRDVKMKVKPMYNPVWDNAIAEAHGKLQEAKKRVTGLKRTIRNWTKLRDSGMPWTGQGGNAAPTQN